MTGPDLRPPKACFSCVFPSLSDEDIPHASVATVGSWDSLATVTLVALVERRSSASRWSRKPSATSNPSTSSWITWPGSTKSVMHPEPLVYTADQVRVGLIAEFERDVVEQDVLDARNSGDFNSLHVNSDYARGATSRGG